MNAGRIFFLFPLVLVLALAALQASALGAPPQFSPSPYAAADTTKQKKERVKKETPPPPAKEQPQPVVYVEDEEDDFWGACLGGCLGSLLGDLFGGNEEENVAPVQPVVEEGPPYAAQIGGDLSGPMRELPFTGIIEPLYGGEDRVGLWSEAGGYEAGATVIESLPEGTQVRAVQYGLYKEDRWLLVSRLEPDAPEGWVLEGEVFVATPSGGAGAVAASAGIAPTAEPGQMPEAATYQETASPEQPLWQVGAQASFPVFSQKAVREEYENQGYQVGFEYGFFLPNYLKLQLFADYLHANGTPLYDYYVGGEIKDSPQESDLEILSFGLAIGQSFPFAAGLGFLSYGLGPALFRVHEHALIWEYEGGQPAGGRYDKLAEWKVGGEAVVAIGQVLGGRMPLSFETRCSVIPWSAAEEKSLTLDYLGTEVISFFTFGVSIGYTF